MMCNMQDGGWRSYAQASNGAEEGALAGDAIADNKEVLPRLHLQIQPLLLLARTNANRRNHTQPRADARTKIRTRANTNTYKHARTNTYTCIQAHTNRETCHAQTMSLAPRAAQADAVHLQRWELWDDVFDLLERKLIIAVMRTLE